MNASTNVSVPDVLPVLPLRDTVVFPMAVTPLAIGQERSIKLVDDAMHANRMIVVVTQRGTEMPAVDAQDLFEVGTASIIHQLLRAPDGSLRIILQGLTRVRIESMTQLDPYFKARVREAFEETGAGIETEALARAARDLFVRMVPMIPDLPSELATVVEGISDAREVAYQIASTAPLSAFDRQAILEIDRLPEKLQRLVGMLQHELAVREMGRKLATDTHEEMNKAQREYFLREQMRTIQRELGEEDATQAAYQDLRQKLEKAQIPEEAKKEAERELNRLEHLPEISPEHGMIRTYLEWLVALPWNKASGGAIDVGLAHRVLDEDHYDLEKVKDRILEYLAVKKLRDERIAQKSRISPDELRRSSLHNQARREPLLCFVGAPGVGKTSLGQSIARAMGRKFVRISLGGIHDEAEIRGHRRTYIGAMPGRIMQTIRRAETCDPVFMLDEVDKLGVGFQGDPSAALLEVLDPAQNYAFVDTYLGVPFDLSQVLFICTANTVDSIPPALLDRVEVLGLPGYTDSEKLQIARRFLFVRLLKAHGLVPEELTVEDEVINSIVHDYTREAGVRNLERSLATVIRKVARSVAEGATTPIAVKASDLHAFLGPQRYFNEMAERIDRPGIATGLAWTPMGGQLLFVEATMMPSQEEKLVLTGMLGDVMRESAQAALSYLRANAFRLRIDPRAFEGKTVHVHVPAGAIPKDGPSAGVAMIVALASLATGLPVRNDVAMTGEISLRGKVLPVGGIKEKVLAAHTAGVRQVVMPGRNAGDAEDVPLDVRQSLSLAFVDSVEEAIGQLLTRPEEYAPAPPLDPPLVH